MTLNEEDSVWPPALETLPADPETSALLALLEASAPQPSAAFGERLYRQVRPAAATGRTHGWGMRRQLNRLIEAFDSGLHGGYDMKRSIAAFVGALVLVAALIIAVVPAARADVLEVLRRVTLGDSTEVRQVDALPGEMPPGEYPWQMPEGTYWIVETDIGKYGANVLPGKDNEVRSVNSLDEAEALSGVRPLAPTELPDGYSLREVNVSSGRWPTFFQFYAGPGPDIVIVQTGVGTSGGEATDVLEATVVSTVTDGTVEEVTFDGRPAAWIDGQVLKWEADGLALDVGGLGLDLSTAMAIGRSLR